MVRAITDRRCWKAGLTFDADDLASVSVPVLMVYGADDAVAQVETWQRFVAQLPDGRLEAIDQAGHLPWFDNPERVSQLLESHFQTAATQVRGH